MDTKVWCLRTGPEHREVCAALGVSAHARSSWDCVGFVPAWHSHTHWQVLHVQSVPRLCCFAGNICRHVAGQAAAVLCCPQGLYAAMCRCSRHKMFPRAAQVCHHLCGTTKERAWFPEGPGIAGFCLWVKHSHFSATPEDPSSQPDPGAVPA